MSLFSFFKGLVQPDIEAHILAPDLPDPSQPDTVLPETTEVAEASGWLVHDFPESKFPAP